MIQNRTLGASNLKVSALGLGCMGMSMGYGQSNDQESIYTLHHAIEKGITFLDTADVYGAGKNEELIRKALIGKNRDQLIIATKCGLVGIGKVDASPQYIKKACEQSLKRLGIECIDLYYLHRADKNVPIEDSVGAFKDLINEGKIRHIGLSEVTSPTLKRAAKIHAITALQSEYSLWERKPEDDILKTCDELNIGFVAYSPLGRGFLSGKYRNTNNFEEGDFRKMLPKYQDSNLKFNLQAIDKLIVFAKEKGCTAAQLSLAWLLAQRKHIVPIPGTRSVKRLDENVGALEINLSEAELEEINQLIPKNAIKGNQYPDEFNLEV
jgi:aryl-alcohol dehydrogenase-like predicted oxidoreductase